MGDFQFEDTHGNRSSSMSFALRWKHENLRLITLTAVISFAMTFMFLVLLYGTATKSVSVVVNGRETVVETKQWVLQRLLDEQAISIGEHDRISLPVTSSIKDGDRVVIDHAIPVQVTADGQTKTVYTTEKTVRNAIEKSNISIGKEDKVMPSLDQAIASGGKVTVVRVKKTFEDRKQTVPFEVVKKADPTLLKGKEKVVQNGKSGLVVSKVEKVYEDGKLVSAKVVNKLVKTPSVNTIIAVGTKQMPKVTVLSKHSPAVETLSKKGITFDAKQVLKNVTLTAYSAGEESTGKKKGDHGYGMTASGTRVSEGRTIAVDPKVIPMGWWVYIEGIGFRRAEDTGGAVKGKKIDVYFDSEDYVDRFGLKRGYTVYIIGPNKPSAN